jgi:hypothetical protein
MSELQQQLKWQGEAEHVVSVAVGCTPGGGGRGTNTHCPSHVVAMRNKGLHTGQEQSDQHTRAHTAAVPMRVGYRSKQAYGRWVNRHQSSGKPGHFARWRNV